MTQDEALAILKTGANVFLTGEPGSGKTHTVNRYVAWLRERGIEPSITASTGIAATHIGGMTIHSWSGIGIRRDLSAYDLDAISQNKRTFGRVRDARVLIIDEVSMLSARTLAMAEAVCREIRRDQRPFGGLQTLLVGDFFQLPPVNKREDEAKQGSFDAAAKQESSYAKASEDKQFAFFSHVWDALNPLVCYLSEQHRQEDEAFLSFLSAVREGTVGESHKALLRTRYAKTSRGNVTQLYSHNADVNAINDAELAKLPDETKTFEMESRGPEKIVASLKRGCLSPEQLRLKIGARVMFTKNDVTTHRFANGTLGLIKGFSEEGGYPIVQTNSGRQIVAEQLEWSVQDGGRVIARIIQIPLRLAWAITVHKSQGMSLDAAHMDLSDTFEYGQGYVALSRVRTLAGLSLAGLNQRALEVHPKIRAKDAEFRSISQKTRETFAKIAAHELQTMHANFVKACGGSIVPLKEPMQKAARIPTLDATLALLKSGNSIREIAQARGLVETTISSHIFDLYFQKKIGRSHIEPLVSTTLKKALPTIHAVFKELGLERLTPIFEKLERAYSYDDLRFARMLYKD